jgi:uroporphyrinogen-III synthase
VKLVLVTRPIEDFAATEAALARLGFRALAAPCQRVVQLTLPGLPDAAGLLLTSRNAVRAIAAAHSVKRLPAWCVGQATAELARELGFRQAVSADGDAADLAAMVRARCRPEAGALLLPCAQGAGTKLSAALRQAGFRVHRRVVYRMAKLPSLPEAAQEALRTARLHAALFHAAGAAKNFARLLQATGLAEKVRGVEAVAISAAAAEPLGTLPWQKTSWPTRPNEAALLALLGPPAPAALRIPDPPSR